MKMLDIQYRQAQDLKLSLGMTDIAYCMRDFPEAIRLLNPRKGNVKPMVSDILPLDRFLKDLRNRERQPGNYGKILIPPNA
jgi:hypothetical protein